MLHNPTTLAEAYNRARVKEAAQKQSSNHIETQMQRMIELQKEQMEKISLNTKETDLKSLKTDIINEIKGAREINYISNQGAPNNSLDHYKREQFAIKNQAPLPQMDPQEAMTKREKTPD